MMLGLRKALISGLATFLPGSVVRARKGLLRHAARVLLECFFCPALPQPCWRAVRGKRTCAPCRAERGLGSQA